MRFVFHKFDSLPCLAWCAVIEKGTENIDVFHGNWVETFDSFFVEGVWGGPFAEGGFHKSFLFMGSGAELHEDEVIFPTPCHAYQRLHTIRIENKLFISPSLTFLLKKAGCRLDINYISYQADLLLFISELKYNVGSIPIKGGNRVNIYHYRNIKINSELRVNVTHKNEPTDFENYKSYKEFLIKSLSSLYQNANSQDRKIKYTPISMLSSGYDSPACAAIGTEIGLRESVNIRTGRPDKGGIDDRSMKIGEKLGIHGKEYERNGYLQKKGFPEAEFFTTGDLGQDLHMSIFENDFSQKFVIHGEHGEIVWDIKPLPIELPSSKRISRDIVRPDAGFCSLEEFRLRVGFFLIPVAMFGCLSYPSIYKISNSEEMAPWKVGNIGYDRPIPRRIAEEKGVDRHLFGQSKKASTVLLNTNDNILSGLSPDSVKSFEEFTSAKRRNGTSLNKHLILYCTN